MVALYLFLAVGFLMMAKKFWPFFLVPDMLNILTNVLTLTSDQSVHLTVYLDVMLLKP